MIRDVRNATLQTYISVIPVLARQQKFIDHTHKMHAIPGRVQESTVFAYPTAVKIPALTTNWMDPPMMEFAGFELCLFHLEPSKIYKSPGLKNMPNYGTF
jgi:hypothetical protein